MHPSTASLVRLIPVIFACLKIRFDLETGDPLLIVKVIKQTNGTLNATVEPDVGITEQLNGLLDEFSSWDFVPGAVFELRFTADSLAFRVNGDSIADPYIYRNTKVFLDRFGRKLHGLAADLKKVLESLPSAERLTEVMAAAVDLRLTEALLSGDTEAFMTGPTIVKMLSKDEVNDLNGLGLMAIREIMNSTKDPSSAKVMAFLALVRENSRKQAQLADMVRDWHYVVIGGAPDKDGFFFETTLKIITTAANVLLPDIVAEKRRALLDKVGPVVAAIDGAT